MLDGFKVVNLTIGLPTLSITQNGVGFNKTAIIKMNYPEYVLLMINPNEKKVAIQECQENVDGAIQFYKDKKKNGVVSVRWNNKDFLNTVSRMMDWNLEENGYRINAEYLEEENALVFDLKEAEEIEQKK